MVCLLADYTNDFIPTLFSHKFFGIDNPYYRILQSCNPNDYPSQSD